jgi:hypothetical protein
MSIATSFKHYQSLPFCVESKTDAEISGIGFFAYDCGTDLADLMHVFWNIEAVRLGYGSPLVFEDVDLADAGVTVQPSARVCFETEYDGVAIGSFIDTKLTALSDVITDGISEYRLRLAYRGAVKSTDDGTYYLLITFDVCADDGAVALATTDANNANCTLISAAVVDIDLGVSVANGVALYEQSAGLVPSDTFSASKQADWTY